VVIHIITGVLLFVFIRLTLMIPFLRRRPFRAELVGAEAPPTDEINTPRRSGFSRDHPQTGFFPGSLDERTVTCIALGAALIWLVHPIQTQAVSYIVQRMTSMAALFYLLAFVLYIKGRLIQDDGWKRWLLYAGAILSGLLAVGSKEIALTLPFFILLYEWFFFRDLDRAWLKRGLIFLGVALVVLVPVVLWYTKGDPFSWFLRGYAHRDFTLTERVMTEFRIVVHYLSLLVFPYPGRLNLDYDFPLSTSLITPITTLLSLGFLVSLLILAIYLAKNYRIFSFCILWYLGNLVIESSVIGLELVYEHRNYLPSMLVFPAAVLLVYHFLYQRWRYVTVGLLCLLIAVFSLWTYQRNLIWSDDLLLWQDTVTKSPNKARPYNNLGMVLVGHGRSDEAIHNYKRALEIHPDYVEAHNNLGLTYALLKRTDEAIEHFTRIIQLHPNDAKAHKNLGLALLEQGKVAEAVEHCQEAVRIAPGYADAYHNLGLALNAQGRHAEAVEQFQLALRINPQYAEVHYNLGKTLADLGSLDAAIHQFRSALALQPDMAEARNGLGVALARTGDLEGAIGEFQEALRIDPQNLGARRNLEIILMMIKD